MSELIPNEQPEHKQVRVLLETQHELGRMTVEECFDFIQTWVELTGGEHELS